jgi:hypothetical protein
LSQPSSNFVPAIPSTNLSTARLFITSTISLSRFISTNYPE